MQDLIKAIRELGGDFLSAASAQEIERLEESLGVSLPDEIRQLYSDHNGQGFVYGTALRLMSTGEVELIQSKTSFLSYIELGEICLFWTNDNSDYAGLYLDGPFQGMICLLEHDGGFNTAPAYRSIGSFYAHQIASSNQDFVDIRTLSKDFPVLRDDLSDELRERDHHLFKIAMRRYEGSTNEEERQQSAYAAVNLVPYDHTDEIYPLLEDSDMYIKEAACELLGKRGWARATNLLERIALGFNGNAVWASIFALGMIRGGEHSLLRIFEAADRGDAPNELKNWVIHSLSKNASRHNNMIAETEPGVFFFNSFASKTKHILKVSRE